MKGKSEYSYDWNDAKWYFATAENRDLFAADPEHYAPKYGGY
jgi:YHS domain-containing protein